MSSIRLRCLATLPAALIAANVFAQSITTLAGGGFDDGRAATAATLDFPQDVALDSGGNLYIADFYHNRIRRVSSSTGFISTVAGSGSSGFFGDGGPAVAAGFEGPTGVAIDRFGNVYIAARSSNRIRKVSALTGNIETVAGGSTEGYSGDGDLATLAKLSKPERIAIDAAGNLFIADTGNHVIRRVDAASGKIQTIAGTGAAGSGLSQLSSPTAIAIGAGGALLICDTGNHRVLRLSSPGAAMTLEAGTGISGSSGDDIPATEAALDTPRGITIDSAGNIYIVETGNNRIRVVDGMTHRIKTVTGGGSGGFRDGAASDARFDAPKGIAIDRLGNLFIADSASYRIRKYTAAISVVTTVAGNGDRRFLGDGGPATFAAFDYPITFAIDPLTGHLIVADLFGRDVRKITLGSGVPQINTIAGSHETGDSGDGIPATKARIQPAGLAFDRVGNLYISHSRPSDPSFHIRIVDRSGIINNFAGTGARGNSGDGGLASEATFNEPIGLAVDNAGYLYVADSKNHRVRRINLASRIIENFAGTGTAGFSGDGDPATLAQLNEPFGIAVDAAGFVYIADKENHRVRRVDTAGRITTVAGSGPLDTGNPGYGGDGGQATLAKIGRPRSVSIDSEGALFIADAHNHRIRRVDLKTGIIQTFAGTGTAGDSGDGGPATLARLADAWGVIVDDAGNLYIADADNKDIRAVFACSSVGGPSLVSPRDNSTNVALGPVLRWDLVSRAFRYDVYLDTSTTPTRIIASDVSGSSYALGNLAPATKYYWKVVAKGDPFCTPQSTFSSPVASFTTTRSCAAPASFSLTNPAEGTTGIAAPVTLSWQAATGASSYDVFLGTSNPPPFVTTTQATSFSASSLIPGTDYFWQVRARAECDATLQTSTSIRTFRAAGACQPAGAFSTVAPFDGETGVSPNITLQWGASANAGAYNVYLGQTNPPQLYAANVAANSLEVSGLLGNQKYYWRVIANTPCNSSGNLATSVVSFTTRPDCPVPAAPSLIAPPGKIAAGQTYVIAWREAANLDAAGSYLIERSQISTFATLLDSQEVATNFASFVAPSSGIFYHRVRAIPGCDPNRAGPFSETREANAVAGLPNVIFTVQPRAVVVPLLTQLELQKGFFTLENLTSTPLQVFVSRTEIASVPFFTIHDPLAADSPLITLAPHEPRTFELRFAGPPVEKQGSYQGLVVVSVPGSPVIPYAFVNLKVGSEASAKPKFLVNGTESEYAFFPGLSGDDRGRAPISVEIENIGNTPMEVGFEIGPELWLFAETDWQSIPPGGRKTVRLSTRRDRAPNGSALPRYTYLTARTRSGETARLLVQDNDAAVVASARTIALEPRTRSLIVPEVVSRTLASRLRLSNVGGDAVQTELIFTPRGSDGFDPSVRRATILVPPGNVVTLTDPLTQIFGLTPPATGQIEVRASAEKIGFITVAATLHSLVRADEVLWQIPTIWRGEGATSGKPHRLVGIAATNELRTSLLFAETTGVEQTVVRAVLYDKNGTRLGDRLVTVPRYGVATIDDVGTALSGGASVEGGRLEISVETGGGAVVGLAKISPTTKDAGATLTSEASVDTTSAKGKSGMADSVTRTAVVLPVAIAGSLASNPAYTYRTLLGLVGSSGSASSFLLTYIDANGNSTERTVNVDAGKSTEYKNVLKDLFDIANGQGAMIIQVPVGGRIYASVSTVSPVGQVSTGNVPVAQPGSLTSTGGAASGQRPLYLDGLEQSVDPSRGTRWNLYLTEVGGKEGSVVIRLYEAGNRSLPIAEKSFTVRTFRQLPLETIFSAMDLDTDERRKDRTDVLVVVTPKSGSALIVATAMAIDNRTGNARNYLLSPSGGVPATGASGKVSVVPPPPARRRVVRRG